ncbi:MAG: ATP-binding cassette domain-containing protein [Thioalkalivibrio sp.]|nr:ATP-binding cassette domain-containing protein [Thioalkalivibrio sp.]
MPRRWGASTGFCGPSRTSAPRTSPTRWASLAAKSGSRESHSRIRALSGRSCTTSSSRPVPQDAFLFSDSIAANIALGRSGPVERAVVEAAARVAQLDEQVSDFPKGYDTLLGERGINLSGGQKQRTALARALGRDPALLVLDDALSAVDTHTEAKILSDLRSVTSSRTTFIISHRVSAVMNADLILVLEDGRIVQRGKHADLIAQEGTYARLLRRQMLEEDLESGVAGAVG